MSHFKTLVFTKTGDEDEIYELLAPYDENIENNDRARWDWWSFGGRFAYDLRLKELDEDGEPMEANHAKFSHLLIDDDPQADKENGRFWDEYVEGSNRDSDEYANVFFKPEYYKEQYGTKERFLRICGDDLMPQAFVDPEGEWHEQGTMGWFACSDATPETIDNFFDEWEDMCKRAAEEDLYVTIVDCHI